jgi:hypothetical protein
MNWSERYEFIKQVFKVNGKTGNAITLDATDVGAIPTAAKGAAGGVAELGDDGKVPSGQLPSLSATDVGAIPSTAKGAAGGVAELGDDGKVPSGQLPSYVDDVAEYANSAAFPLSGEAGKIYVAKDSNKTYRWSGTAYVEISASLALGETASTAYAGDKGKTAYNHSQKTASAGDIPHGITKSLLGVVEGIKQLTDASLNSIKDPGVFLLLGTVTGAPVDMTAPYLLTQAARQDGDVTHVYGQLVDAAGYVKMFSGTL